MASSRTSRKRSTKVCMRTGQTCSDPPFEPSSTAMGIRLLIGMRRWGAQDRHRGRSNNFLFHTMHTSRTSHLLYLFQNRWSARRETPVFCRCRATQSDVWHKFKSHRAFTMRQEHTQGRAGPCGVVLHQASTARFDSAQGSSGGRSGLAHRSPGETEPTMNASAAAPGAPGTPSGGWRHERHR